MDFSFSDEQQQLRRTVREFAESEIAPHVMEWDEASQFPSELLPKLAELGLLGVIFPEQYGGAGLGYIEYALAIEELSRVDGSPPVHLPIDTTANRQAVGTAPVAASYSGSIVPTG